MTATAKPLSRSSRFCLSTWSGSLATSWKTSRSNNEPLLAEVFAFIEAHYQEPISLKDIVGAVGLTPGQLTTIVRRKTGRTVQSWILERRMAEARHLLVNTDRTVAQVGRSVGYGDPVYFSRAFRQANGQRH